MTQPLQASTARRGFTMAEMVVAVTIMVIVTAVVASLFVQVRKMVALSQWMAETRSQLRTTVQTLGDDLKNVNDQAYFIMLNRDYQGAKLYPGATATMTLPADRIAFVSQGPFNSMPNGMFGSSGGPGVATSARIYYGHSLWTHEWADAVWANTVWTDSVMMTLRPVNDTLGPVRGKFMTGFDSRWGTDWCLVRRAVLHGEDPSADAGVESLNLRDGARPGRDCEFRMLLGSLNLYECSDLSRWASDQLAKSSTQTDVLSLIWAPQVYSSDTPLRWDSTVAPGRVLMPHAARVRFQVRLSDGTIVPQTNDAEANPLQRGLLGGTSSGTAVTLDPSYSSTGPLVLDPTPAGPPPSITVKQQYTYIWTGTKTNLQTAQTPLWPVALHVRIDVYDPQKRTPDPIRVDEWLPIRWGSQPSPAP